jgi:hypothetical protein
VARDRDPLVGHSPIRRRFASIEGAAVAGIICAVGWSLSVRGLLATPCIGAPDAEIERFYADASATRPMIIRLQVLVFSTIAFLWFVGVIRTRLGDQEPKLFGTVFFGASVLLAGLHFVGAASLGRATNALPRWLIWLTYGVAVVELVNVTLATPTIYLMPAWIAVVSVVALVRRPPHAFALEQATT